MVEYAKKRKLLNISKDFILNLCASLVSTGIAQLLLYPVLAYYLSSDSNGTVLTIMGIANTAAVACGNSLNNARLLVNSKYEDSKIRGDFPQMLAFLLSISVIIISSILCLFYSQSVLIIILVIIYTCLCMVRTYVCVEYRIILNYKRILLSNICVAIGNIIGIGIYLFIDKEKAWPIPFIVGEACAFIYLLRTTSILKEPFKITRLFRMSLSKEAVLLVTSFSTTMLSYLDRLLLLPLLGGEAVSSYTVASVFGKSLGILMTPLSGVLLSYYSQRGFSLNRKLFWKINAATILAGSLFCVISIFISPWFTQLLYPKLFDNACAYLLIANTAGIVGVMGNMTTPSVLKFAPIYWQLVVQGAYFAVYLLGGMYAVQIYGLWGFAIVALVASFVKLFLLYIIGSAFIKK